MTESGDEYERTIACAEIALGKLKALRQPAIPRNYEIWYTYATGSNPSLNQAINEKLAQSGSLNDEDLERVNASYISPTRTADKVANVGSLVLDEINQVMAIMDAAVGSANNHAASLTDATNKLDNSKDRESIRPIIKILVQTANEMKTDNNTLKQRLNASRDEINQLQKTLEVVRAESLTDALTGLANRKHFDNRLSRLMQKAAERSEPLSLVMIDIDHFKMFNDSWGHLTGDQVLRLVAITLKKNVKGQDIVARYGGEEFAVILPNTVLRSALTVADQIRRVVMSRGLVNRSTGLTLGRMTISLGAAIMRNGDDSQSFIARADACLYAAKRNGRNRVICETDPELAAGVAEPKVA